jgi:hypothetical protein
MNESLRILSGALLGFGLGYAAGLAYGLMTVATTYDLLLHAFCVALAASVCCGALETLPVAWGWKRSALIAAIAPVCYAAFSWLLSDRSIDLVEIASSSFGYAVAMSLLGHRFFAPSHDLLVDWLARLLAGRFK